MSKKNSVISARFFEMDFLQTHYRILFRTGGVGPSIFFIHGLNHSGEIWTAVMQELVRSYEVIALDLPGFGASPALRPELIDLSQYSALLNKIIIKYFGDLQPFVIVADSLGALLALRLLSSSNIITRRFALSGCPIDGLPRSMGFLKAKGLIASSIKKLQNAPRTVSFNVLRLLISLSTVHRLRDVDPAIINGIMNADANTTEILYRQLYDPTSELGEQDPSTKTVVIRGEKDRLVSRNTSTRLANTLNADYVEIAGVGHTPMVENVNGYLEALSLLLT